VAAEGEAEVVMFSGGEPTIHKEILHFIDLARPGDQGRHAEHQRDRLATDRRFVAELGARNRPGRPLSIYLQFDGLENRRTVRSAVGPARTEGPALDKLRRSRADGDPVAAVERGVNDHELGAIISFGLAHPAVRSVPSAGHPRRAARRVSTRSPG